MIDIRELVPYECVISSGIGMGSEEAVEGGRGAKLNKSAAAAAVMCVCSGADCLVPTCYDDIPHIRSTLADPLSVPARISY